MKKPNVSRAAGDRAWLRWSLGTVPSIVLLGLISAKLGNFDSIDPWFQHLVKPKLMPPAWVFSFAWSILYILMGFALALVIGTPGVRARGIAIGLFLVQLGLNLAWSPVFFGQHRIMLALGLIISILLWSIAATAMFWRIRRIAGLLMLPYLAWLMFAGYLNWGIQRLNPYGVALVPGPAHTQIIIQ
jgi:tryptophan-rich sensory protein